MKQFKILLLLLSLTLYSAAQISKESKKGNVNSIGKAQVHGVLLSYVGNIRGLMNVSLGYHVEMDSLIGLRCDIVVERGNSIVSHIGVFYKFSKPDHTIFYNFLTHSSTINGSSSSPGGGPDLTIVEKNVMIDSFNCTHIQYKKATSNEVFNCWMSTQVPGFGSILNQLMRIGIPLPGTPFIGTIFQWGWLVRLNGSFTDHQGDITQLAIELVEANPDAAFPASDFDPPSK